MGGVAVVAVVGSAVVTAAYVGCSVKGKAPTVGNIVQRVDHVTAKVTKQ